MPVHHRPVVVIDLTAGNTGLGLGTHVRLEAGRQQPTVETLRRLAQNLRCEFVIHVGPGVAA